MSTGVLHVCGHPETIVGWNKTKTVHYILFETISECLTDTGIDTHTASNGSIIIVELSALKFTN